MAHIVIVGGGFAGVWCAAAAVRECESVAGPHSAVDITLVTAADDIVIRPRLYEAGPEQMRVSLDRILGPIGVRRTVATVTDIDSAGRRVTAVSRTGETVTLSYDRLVLASGSLLVRPAVPGAEHLFDVDTMPGAAALAAHLDRLSGRLDEAGRFTAVVVGAGFTGLEVATEMHHRLALAAGGSERVRVALVERAAVVGPELGAGPRPEITSALSDLEIEVRLETTVSR